MANTTGKVKKREGVALLLTGSELMSGDILDSNSAMLAHLLSDRGIEVSEKCTLADDKELLIQAIERLSREYRCLIINGGLGPTSDDLTAEALAAASDRALEVNAIADKHVRSWCQKRGHEANTANLKQSILPQDALILTESPGSAVAFYIVHNDCLILATPGVPSELKTIMLRQACQLIQEHLNVAAISLWQRYTLFGMGESQLQQLIDVKLPQLQDYYEIGYRAGLPTLELKLKSRPFKEDINNAVINKALSILNPYIIGHGAVTLAECVVQLLKDNKQTISFAESCTGGLIASQITGVPGSSSVFPGAIVSYSNAMKVRLLGVDDNLLNTYGAVSEEVANAMHSGVLKIVNSDYAVAVTGVAGPDGGSDEKPVGSVWIAWGSTEQSYCEKLLLKHNRQDFQKLVAAIAFDLIRRQLLKLDPCASIKRWVQ